MKIIAACAIGYCAAELFSTYQGTKLRETEHLRGVSDSALFELRQRWPAAEAGKLFLNQFVNNWGRQ
jgi:hypothetical protein